MSVCIPSERSAQTADKSSREFNKVAADAWLNVPACYQEQKNAENAFNVTTGSDEFRWHDRLHFSTPRSFNDYDTRR